MATVHRPRTNGGEMNPPYVAPRRIYWLVAAYLACSMQFADLLEMLSEGREDVPERSNEHEHKHTESAARIG